MTSGPDLASGWLNLDHIEHIAQTAAAACAPDWAWDGATLFELDHEESVGIQCSTAAGSPAASLIAEMTPRTVLRLVAETRAVREYAGTLLSAIDRRDIELDLARRIIAELRPAVAVRGINLAGQRIFRLTAALAAYDEAVGGDT